MSGFGDVKAAERAWLERSFDKKTFGTHLRANISEKQFGEGKCARHVRLALFASGRKLVSWPASAKDWGSALLALGFIVVPDVTHVPQCGDVAVMQPPRSATTKHGHIQGYDGTNWISDFVQAEFWPGPAYRKDKPSYVIYRF
jgi:hypothetical protein